MALTELTLDQWGTAKRIPNRVEYINDSSLADVMYKVAGNPQVLVINLAAFADLVDGKVAGAAIDADSLKAGQIAPGAVETSELADDAVTGRKVVDRAVGEFDLPAAVPVAHSDGGPVELLALDATVDRLVLVRAVATEAAAGGPEFDVGSVGDVDGCFDDLAAGAWALGDKFVGFYMLPAGENLRVTINAAGTAGEIDFYVAVLTPIVHTANIANLAVATGKIDNLAVTTGKIAAAAVDDMKMAYPALDDPGNQAMGLGRATGVWTARTAVPAAGDTVTIGTDVFEIDRIDLDSTDDTANNDFNNVTDPLTVELTLARGYAACGVDGANPLLVGQLVYIGAEYLRVTAIVGNDVTFGRGRGGSAIAVHADVVNIFWSASHITGATANIPVGIQGANNAAAVGTPIVAATVNDDDGAAGQANDVTAQSLAAGADFLITADDVGVVALATLEVAANFAWDEALMWRGEGPGRHQVFIRTLIVSAAEAAAGANGEVYCPLPFDPLRAVVTFEVAGVHVPFEGSVVFTGAIAPLPALIQIVGVAATPLLVTDRVNIIAWGD